MKETLFTQPVTNRNIDMMCDRYISCGWVEYDVVGKQNCIEAVIFKWNKDSIPVYPSISDLYAI